MDNKTRPLWRLAIGSGALALGIPLIWAVLGSIPGNVGLTIGWYGVLPMLLVVPIGVGVTLVLFIAMAIAAVNQDQSKNAPIQDQDRKSDSN